MTGMSGRMVILRFADGWTVEPQYLPAFGRPLKAELVDLDRDGERDLLVASDAGLAIHWSDGQGGFSLPQVIAPGSCVTARGGDLNGDGLADILAVVYATPQYSSKSDPWAPTGLLAFLGNGRRGFALVDYAVAWGYGNDLALGDWNEDGVLDAALGAWLDVYFLLGQGNGRLKLAGGAQGGGGLRVIARDLNGDRHLDLARLSFDESLQPALYGDGRGAFQPGPVFWPHRGTTPQPPRAYNMDSGEFDEDGTPDLLLVHEDPPLLFRGTPRGGFARGQPLPLPRSTWAAAMADVDADGALDIVAHNPHFGSVLPGGFPPSRMSVLHGDGRGGLRGVRSAARDALSGFEPPCAIGDLNGDGLPDRIEALGSNLGIRVHLSDGAGGWSAPIHHPKMGLIQKTGVGDVDGDGRQDLVGSGTVANEMIVHLGDGAGGFGRGIVNQLGASFLVYELDLIDLDRDGRSDLVLRDVYPTFGALRVHMSRGAGTFGPAIHHPGLAFVQSVRPADVDLDGHTDLVAVQWHWPRGLSRVLVLPGLGDGHFGEAWAVEIIANSIPAVQVGDLNGDGLPDLAVGVCRFGVSPESELVAHLATSPGVFGGVAHSRLATQVRQLALADLDGDGILDLLAGQPWRDDELLRGRGDGQFEAWCQLGSPSELRAIADMDRDGRNDLVYESTVLLNQAP